MASEKHGTGIEITLCGPSGAGKTSLANLLISGSFPKNLTPSTITLESFTHPVQNVKITLSNKPPDELLKNPCKVLRKTYFEKANDLLIIIDGKKLPDTEELKKYFALADKNNSIHLVVNKIDEPGAVRESVATLLQKAKIDSTIIIHFISAKDGYGIQALVDLIRVC